jgi:hypothetical protein
MKAKNSRLLFSGSDAAHRHNRRKKLMMLKTPAPSRSSCQPLVVPAARRASRSSCQPLVVPAARRASRSS